jgi:RNA polymerase sigma-70 factor (ECF subfamily)
MSTSPLDDLLRQLCSGDRDVAAQVFLEYEPYLRKVVRRLLPDRLRAKFDSHDIVQSIWGDLVKGFREAGWQFASANQLRSFLIKVTRNRFLDHLRHHDRVVSHEEPWLDRDLDHFPSGPHVSPSKNAQADDLWQRMLELCPPEHHVILRLKRQGTPLEEIVAATGLHAGSIRRILRRLASQLASDQPGTPDTP